MTEYREGRPGALDLYRQFKPIGATPTGETVYAEVMALEAGSIGSGGGGGTASSVTIADGTIAAQLLAVDASGRITANINGTIPVSGTFWQATQPVSGTFFQATQPVSGTFWQATQPVSIASMPTTPVTGTFWQATQPVSGTVTANQGGTWTVQPGNTANTTAWKVDGSAVTQPVSGTFWQATQPVSVASMPSTPVTGTFWQATQPVSGTFWQATQPVSISGNQGVNVAQINGVTPLMGAGNTGTGSPRVTIATDQSVIPVSDNAGSLTVDAPLGTPLFATLTPNTAGGWSPAVQTALTNTKTSVKASAGTFGGYMIYNPNASVVHIQVWDLALASITVGTTAPTYVLTLPATAAANLEFANGVNHAVAISVAATTTPTGSTAPGSAVVCSFFYK